MKKNNSKYVEVLKKEFENIDDLILGLKEVKKEHEIELKLAENHVKAMDGMVNIADKLLEYHEKNKLTFEIFSELITKYLDIRTNVRHGGEIFDANSGYVQILEEFDKEGTALLN